MKNTQQITVRLPVDLDTQIAQRAELNRRSKNAEIVILLEGAIDSAVQRELNVANRTPE